MNNFTALLVKVGLEKLIRKEPVDSFLYHIIEDNLVCICITSISDVGKEES